MEEGNTMKSLPWWGHLSLDSTWQVFFFFLITESISLTNRKVFRRLHAQLRNQKWKTAQGMLNTFSVTFHCQRYWSITLDCLECSELQRFSLQPWGQHSFGCCFLIGLYASWIEVAQDLKFKKIWQMENWLPAKHLVFLGNALFLVESLVQS